VHRLHPTGQFDNHAADYRHIEARPLAAAKGAVIAPILQSLAEHLVQDAFCCRLRWETNMVVAWDNRLCVHQAYNDYQRYRREMYRTTVGGEKPV
jgi:alpha-ketoglutarate-dependent taurine dioxygenase